MWSKYEILNSMQPTLAFSMGIVKYCSLFCWFINHLTAFTDKITCFLQKIRIRHTSCTASNSTNTLNHHRIGILQSVLFVCFLLSPSPPFTESTLIVQLFDFHDATVKFIYQFDLQRHEQNSSAKYLIHEKAINGNSSIRLLYYSITFNLPVEYFVTQLKSFNCRLH